ncbi:6-hydroxymethylpterin diphosphokinase MptE-like protein [Methanolobus sp. ZRKC3]|uniref:6-hydroxymethylpterin diphosphokinase MptE-like protein n=1 Tax=Methanolobus sp. ZRKC3 TaxID=3125786 RepID=UPI00324B0524
MEFEKWEPIYSRVLEDMGFSREDDERAAIMLSHMLDPSNSVEPSVLGELIDGRDVLVCGNAPTLRTELDLVDLDDYLLVVADGAASALIERDVVPDVIVTDLDGDVEKEILANSRGSIVVVHAHGDNTDKLEKYVPLMQDMIGSTQSFPLSNVYNFGGFSDGDRCVFLAKEFGAASITLIGFDFTDPEVTSIKKKKLNWAKKLIDMIISDDF